MKDLAFPPGLVPLSLHQGYLLKEALPLAIGHWFGVLLALPLAERR